ncbi:hypothetical protein QFW77_03335 [Luteimonas sp. RD2P54]|uniref:Type III secretion protein HrpB2 n=1 Tax=Luteimonas endophytica TaxID=3042023 RepID=A0ABT6J778_9GAMM|nr:hypothetical protein [Luteimonas endophytica]MDH5822028.1 hypothetical protein [Luteimonas endophytica]
MIEAIQVAAMEPQATTAASAAAQPQASAIEVRDFAQAMQRTGGVGQADPAAAPEAVAGASATDPSQGTRMMISAFDSLNGSAKNIEAMSQAMSGSVADLSPGQMLEMTMKCHEFLFQSQLTSNVANRTSDGVQQLFRQQS